MLRLELGRSKSTSDLYRAKEWAPLWSHQYIRLNYKAFCLLCLYLEFVDSLSIEGDLHDVHQDSDQSMVGLFRVLSNALVHLEEQAHRKVFDKFSELTIFLGKILIEQGVFPNRGNCVFCDIDLLEVKMIHLVTDHGGFGCGECVGHLEEAVLSTALEGRELWELLGVVANEKYLNLKNLEMEYPEVARTLLNYFFYQFHFKANQFKSLSSVF